MMGLRDIVRRFAPAPAAAPAPEPAPATFGAGTLQPVYGAEVPSADLARDYIAGALRRGDAGLFHDGEGRTRFEADYARFGPALLDLVGAEPKVNSTINTIVAGIWADGVQVDPVSLPDPAEQVDLDEEGREARKADKALAAEISDSCARVLAGLETPIEETGRQLDQGGMRRGCKLAEATYALLADGPDAGRLAPVAIRVKPNHAWSFAVDLRGRVAGIAAQPDWAGLPDSARGATQLGAYLLLPRAKFWVRSWNVEDDDPRGRTVLRAAYDPWYRKLQTNVRYDKYTDKFAAPTWVSTAGQDQQPRAVRDSAGNLGTLDRRPEDDNLDALAKLESCSALSLPYGATARAEYPTGDGRAFLDRLAYLDGQIVFAIAQTTRATEESRYGSRADSETAQDLLGLVIRLGKHGSRHALREDVLRPYVRLNWGADAARRLTPTVSLGMTEHQDFSRNARAVAVLAQSGILDATSPADRNAARVFLGFPIGKDDGPKPLPAPGQQPPDGQPGQGADGGGQQQGQGQPADGKAA